ncbi:hypothetical protein WP7S18C02_30000 [Klebsiella sp. WP7-S18-CRE-02]|nr:hypothetical protein WP7S18C02_30000 [Klebsiella sp. WP7-S18-CRE-02]BBS97415.1 hypothetical protein WP7S18C03_30080 [Klebsiella sp. WP7-S18-CRE-03]BBT02482.1 hypothetical protein WP7S18E04_30440 [Klebsiella sp. WP7-S18-ESBL-04]
MYEQDSLSALEAITEAQKIAFAPMLFQTALSLRNTGILAYLDKQGKNGATLSDIAAQCPLNEYAIREGANKQVMSSQADSLIKISRIWADFFPANTSNQPI